MRTLIGAALVAVVCFAGEITPTRVVKLDAPATGRGGLTVRPTGAFVRVGRPDRTDLFEVNLKGDVKRRQVPGASSGRLKLDEYGSIVSASADQDACSTTGLDVAINGHGDLVVNGHVRLSRVSELAGLECGSGIAVMWEPNGNASLIDSGGVRELNLGGPELEAARKHYAHLPPNPGHGFVGSVSITSPVDVWVMYIGPRVNGIPAVHYVNGKRTEKVTLRLPDKVRVVGMGTMRGGFVTWDSTTMSLYIFEEVTQ